MILTSGPVLLDRSNVKYVDSGIHYHNDPFTSLVIISGLHDKAIQNICGPLIDQYDACHKQGMHVMLCEMHMCRNNLLE